MALERAFDCPHRRRRFRSGPLGELQDGFCKWLLEHGFSRSSVRRHVGIVSHLNEHLGAPTARRCQRVTEKDIEGFHKTYPSRCRNRGPLEEHLRRVRYSVNRFVEYLEQKELFVRSPRQAIYQPLLDAYLQWMRRCQHAAEGTLELRARCMTRFLESLSSGSVVGVRA